MVVVRVVDDDGRKSRTRSHMLQVSWHNGDGLSTEATALHNFIELALLKRSKRFISNSLSQDSPCQLESAGKRSAWLCVLQPSRQRRPHNELRLVTP